MNGLTRTINVRQSRPTLTVSPNEEWRPVAGPRNRRINVTSTGNWRARVTSNSNWLSVSGHGTGGNRRLGNGHFTITTTRNTTNGPRSGTITIDAAGAPTRRITVTQRRPTLNHNRAATWNPGPSALNRTVDVTSTANWRVMVTSGSNWLSVSGHGTGGRHIGNGRFTMSTRQNNGRNSRTGTVRLDAPGAPTRTITVTQRGAAATLSLSPSAAWTRRYVFRSSVFFFKSSFVSN